MLYFEDINLFDEVSIEKTFTQEDVDKFAELSGDKNPVHLDKDYASKTIFKHTIVHGALLISEVSAVVGMKYPGHGAIIKNLELKFLAPVYPSTPVKAIIRVINLNPNKKEVILACYVKTEKTTAMEGEIIITMPSRSSKK